MFVSEFSLYLLPNDAENEAIPLYILYFFPFFTNVLPGLSSVPPNKLPIITEDDPAASALVKSPEVLVPPSEITGISYFFAIFTLSIIAVNCGLPEPVTILVIHIEPDPTPTFTASTPAFIKSSVPRSVATLPAISSHVGKAFFINFTVLIALSLWPCAISTTITSAPLFNNASVLSR